MNEDHREGPDTVFSFVFFPMQMSSSHDKLDKNQIIIFLRTSIRFYLYFISILICNLTQLAMEQSPSTAPMFSGDVRWLCGRVWKWTLCVYNVAPPSDEAGNHRLLPHSTFQNKTSGFLRRQVTKKALEKVKKCYFLSLNLKKKMFVCWCLLMFDANL